LVDVVSPGKTLMVEVSIYNLETEEVDFELSLQLIDTITNEVVIEKRKNISAGTLVVMMEKIDISEDIREGKYIVKGTARYQGAREGSVVAIEYVDVRSPYLN